MDEFSGPRPHRQFFSLVRSGRTVADGVIWPGGDCSMKWRGYHESAVYWSEFNDALVIHGHPETAVVFGAREDCS